MNKANFIEEITNDELDDMRDELKADRRLNDALEKGDYAIEQPVLS